MNRPPPMPTEQEFQALVNQANTGDPAARRRLQQVLDLHPEIWTGVSDAAVLTQQTLLTQLAQGDYFLQESLRRGLEQLRQDLQHDGDSALDRLAISRILVCWLHVHYLDLASSRPQASQTPREAAQRRLDNALKTLATLRKM